MSDGTSFLEQFMAEAEKSSERQVYGQYLKVRVNPGFWGYIAGRKRDEQFFFADPEVENSQAKAMAAATAAGSNGPRACLQFTKFKDTSVVKEEYEMQDNYTTYIQSGEFPWEVWAEKSFNAEENPLSGALLGKEIWAHVASVRHPRFDADDEVTWNDETVRWDYDLGQPKLKEDGTIRPRYYDYIRAAFATQEELVQYALANGAEVVGATPTYNFPVPAGWVAAGLSESDWPESAANIVANIQSNTKPKPVFLKQLHSEWGAAGVEYAELEAMYDTVAVPF